MILAEAKAQREERRERRLADEARRERNALENDVFGFEEPPIRPVTDADFRTGSRKYCKCKAKKAAPKHDF